MLEKATETDREFFSLLLAFLWMRIRNLIFSATNSNPILLNEEEKKLLFTITTSSLRLLKISHIISISQYFGFGSIVSGHGNLVQVLSACICTGRMPKREAGVFKPYQFSLDGKLEMKMRSKRKKLALKRSKSCVAAQTHSFLFAGQIAHSHLLVSKNCNLA
jgi:hypothetical protein